MEVERVQRRIFAIAILVILLSLPFALSACSKVETAEAVQKSRFSVEEAGYADYATIKFFVVTDSETKRQWLYIRDTSYGKPSIHVEPLDCTSQSDRNEG